MSWTRLLIVNIIVLIGILIFIELIAAAFYFHRNASVNHTTSTAWLVNGVAKKIDRTIALSSIEGMERPEYDADLILINPKSSTEKQFAKYLLAEYEKEFSELVSSLKNNNIPLWVLWLPTNKNLQINNFYNHYFETVAAKHGVKFLSGKKLLEVPREHIFLEPYNGHLTRYANLLIAEQLYLELNMEKLKQKKPFKCKNIRGMWQANKNEIWPIIPEVPYLLTTDKFGFRSSLPHTEKLNQKPNILIAGDSFTFGPYLSSYDTYPAHLNRKLNTFTVFNGGVSSFSIRSERALIEKNVSCLNPSLVILQVLDNDILGMAVAKYNEYNFKGEVLQIPDIEKQFYENLR